MEKILADLFGDENLTDNLKFITETLKLKSVKNYFEKDFWKDHSKKYQGSQIYLKKI